MFKVGQRVVCVDDSAGWISYHRRAKVRGKQKISDNDLIFILRNLQMKFWSNLNHKRLKSKQ